VQIDGALVEEAQHARPFDLADHLRLALGIRTLNNDPFRRAAAQADRGRRRAFAGPEVAPTAAVQFARFNQICEQVGDRVLLRIGDSYAETLVFIERQLGRGAGQMLGQDHRVIGVEPRMLRAALQHVFGVGDQILVDGVGRCHQHSDRHALPAARASHLLAGAGDCAGIASQHSRIELADIDAQLQRIGRHDGSHGALAQPALDLASLRWEIAAAITADGLTSDE